MKRKDFKKQIEKKEKSFQRAKSYCGYIFSFILLQLLGLFKIGIDNGIYLSRIHISNFMKIEIVVLCIIAVFLWGIFAFYFLYCKYRNREVQYDKLLRRKFMNENLRKYANFGVIWRDVVTLLSHSEMRQTGAQGKVFWGWGDDGKLGVELPKDSMKTIESCTGGFCITKKPWTCTEQKNVNLNVEPYQGKRLETKPFLEMFDICMKKDKLVYNNQIYIYPLFLDDAGNVMKIENRQKMWQNDKEKLLKPFLLYPNMLDDIVDDSGRKQGIIGKGVFDACVNELKESLNRKDESSWGANRCGIVSVFQNVEEAIEDNRNGKCCKTGILVLLQLTAETVKHVKEAAEVTILAKQEEFVEFLSDDRNNVNDQYGVLMYVYAKKNRFEFAEVFLRNYARKNFLDNFIYTFKKVENVVKRDRICTNDAKENLWKKIKYSFRRLNYQFENFICSEPLKKVLFFLVYALENVIEPFASGGAGDELTIIQIVNIIFIENINTLIMLSILVVCWGATYLAIVRKRKRGEKEEKRRRKYVAHSDDKRFEWIGCNKNLFWASNLVEGWNESNIKISLAKDSYKTTEELKTYTTEKIENEKNDGTKYRMIGISSEEEDCVSILVDKCKYTDTMRVQEMLKVCRQKDEEITADRKQEEYVREARSLYRKYQSELENLKSRDEAINLENIPPNSLCMHAVILTKDDYVLLTRRNKEMSYYPSAFDCSAEEQLNPDDFDKDGVRIQNWVARFLEEELGLTLQNCGSTSLGNVKLLSIFIEQDALNVAMAVKIKLNTDKKQLEAILDNWPRQDYEFDYEFVTWEQLISQFEEELAPGKEKRVHPTAVNRIYFVALSEMRYEMAERIKKVATEYYL